MDKNIQKRITQQPYHNIKHLNLTSFPLGNLRNPGIGVNLFDVMLPLYGFEKFELKKEDGVLPGSFEEKGETVLNQEGFGLPSTANSNVNLNTPNQINKLGDVYSAMQKASIETKHVVYNPPKKSKTIKKKKAHKFTFL